MAIIKTDYERWADEEERNQDHRVYRLRGEGDTGVFVVKRVFKLTAACFKTWPQHWLVFKKGECMFVTQSSNKALGFFDYLEGNNHGDH